MAGQDAEIAALRSLALAGAGALQTGSQWEAFMRRVERTAEFGLINSLLIWAQRPDAVDLRSYSEWRRADRQVNRGEDGVRVMKGDGVDALFDLTQTSGKPVAVRLLPRRRGPDGGLCAGDRSRLWEAVGALGLRQGVHVPVLAGGQDGLGQWVGAVTERMCSSPAGGALVGPWARKVAADSVAFLVILRLRLPTDGLAFPSVSSWAAVDERARRTETIVSVGELVVSAAQKAFRCLDANLPPATKTPLGPRLAGRDRDLVGGPDRETARIQEAAARFFASQMRESWVPGYLADRGFEAEVQEHWRIGYAPGAWTALTSHLRGLGYRDAAIEAAGLARRSPRRELVDVFRDRAMFPVHLPDGTVAGFIGRAAPTSGADVPKYVNSRQTALYQKGQVLYDLHEARSWLAAGARPVIVEGPLDAIAVTVSGAGRYVGIAPCGTALTVGQVRLLAGEARLADAGIVVAFDGDQAGQRAAIRAYDLLREHASRLDLVVFPHGQDPASVLLDEGPAAVLDAPNRAQPLADAVINATIDKFSRWLEFVEGKFNALAAVAPVIARLPNDQVARQVTRVAGLLDLTHGEVTAAVTNAAGTVVRDDTPVAGSRRAVSSPQASATRRRSAPGPATAARRRAG